MTIRFVVRPEGFKRTPSKLAQALQARQTLLYAPGTPYFNRRAPLDADKDLFLCAPDVGLLPPNQRTEDRALTNRFFRATKGGQRKLLQEWGVKTPESYPACPSREDATNRTAYVVRPLRHFGGQEYRVTNSPTDFNPALEYISPLFPKEHEYRVIYLKGQPVITLYKRLPETEVNFDGPWGHDTASTFVTVNNPENNRGRNYPKFYEDFGRTPLVRGSHLLGVDVMIARNHKYAVCEVNFCPSVTIDGNLTKIATLLSGLNGQTTTRNV